MNVQINGTWYRFPRGTRIADACRSVGVPIPCFCYHPKLAVVGSCRMCLVEQGMPPRLAPGQTPSYDEQGFQPIQWMPRPIISCANTVAENMGVRTDSPLAAEARRGVLEFPAHQPSAGLPHLRPGRRMQASGILQRLRPD